MTLVERIKETAKKRGWNLKTTADKAGIGINSIYRWKEQTPTTESLSKVANVLGVSVDYLLGRDETPDWADKKDSIDLKEFLDNNLKVNMAFDGEDLTEEEIERLKVAMTQIFWDKRKREK